MSRQLASIQIARSVEPVENSDNLDVVQILGWQCVAVRGEFKEKDKIIYVEIDSVLPDRPEFGFMRPRKFRVRTIKLRGQVSQGIVFPVSILPHTNMENLPEGMDVTEALGIIKYAPPIPACLVGVVRGGRPDFVLKTDETRVQVLQPILDKYAGGACFISEKLDGSSVSYFIKDGEFGTCSRNMWLLEGGDDSYWKVAKELRVEEKLREYGRNLVLQGELVGEGIQGNKLKLKGQTVYFYTVFDIDNFKYLDFEDYIKVMADLGFEICPILYTDYKLQNSIEEIIKLSTTKSKINPDVWAEGIVIRPLKERIDLLLSSEKFNNGRMSFKCINPSFLLKYDE